MKSKIILFFVFFSMNLQLQSQPIMKAWDMRYGGTEGEFLFSFQKTTDSGFILGGNSASDISGDKTQPSWGSSDFWVVKINASGNKEWDKKYGGGGSDGITALEQTIDGGYILAGVSNSGMTGDKTQPRWGGVDYWLVKIDSLGNKQWDKRFGGLGDDLLLTIIQTNDGGYIFGGQSNSNTGGDKSENVRGGNSLFNDYWVVKIDSIGNKEWDKTFGGFSSESLRSILQTDDGGYLLGGSSWSGASGDRTEPNINPNLNAHSSDAWLVKIDLLGNKEWDRVYGTVNSDGVFAMRKAHDGNYIFGWGGKYIKIDNNGNTLWSKVFNGCAGTNDITLTSDNGFLVSGTSSSNCSISAPDKSEANLGTEQTWFVKTDSAFNKQWDKTVFSVGEDYYGMAVEAEDGCFVIASFSNSGIGGYKSQSNWGAEDFWVVSLCKDSLLSLVINKINDDIGIAIYPNPFVKDIAITLEKKLKEATFAITTIEGKIIYIQHETHLANQYTKILDFSNLPDGVYFVTVSAEGRQTTKRVVKQ